MVGGGAPKVLKQILLRAPKRLGPALILVVVVVVVVVVVSYKMSKGVFSCPQGGYGQGGVIDIWPLKPFEAVPVIKGYTNNIGFN